jgi:hypothetical protein
MDDRETIMEAHHTLYAGLEMLRGVGQKCGCQ